MGALGGEGGSLLGFGGPYIMFEGAELASSKMFLIMSLLIKLNDQVQFQVCRGMGKFLS